MQLQIQCFPTPFIWQGFYHTDPEEVLAVFAAAPVSSADQTWVFGAGQTEAGTAVTASFQSASFGDVFIHQTAADGTAVTARFLGASWDSLFVLNSATEAGTAVQSAAPTASRDQVWIFGPAQTEGAAVFAAPPVASHS